MSASQAMSVLVVSATFVVGMVLALLGNLKLELARRPDQTDRRVRFLLITLNASLIPLVLLAGVLSDFLGTLPMLILGSVLLWLAFLTLSSGLGYRRTLFATLTAALGAAALLVSTISLMPRGLFCKDQVVASMYLGTVFIALGALLTPVLIDLLFRLIGFRRTMALLAFVFLIPGCLTALPPRDLFGELASGKQVWQMLEHPAVWVAPVVFFFYAPLEAFITAWTSTYLTGLGRGDRQSKWLATFWIVVFSCRLLCSIVFYWGELEVNYMGAVLTFLAFGSVAVLGNMRGTTNYGSAYLGIIFLGLLLGPIYPTLLGMLLRMEDARGLPGLSYALLFVGGSVGSLLLSPLVRISANARKFETAMLAPLMLALLLFVSSMAYALLYWRQAQY